MDTYKDLCNIETELPTMRPEGAPVKAAPTAKKGPAMTSTLIREQAFELVKKYNKDPFHIRHALTVEGVMRWYAKDLGWELDQLLEKTISAMQSCEKSVEEACK